MGIPFFSRRRSTVRQPQISTAISFTMEDFAEMQGYATALAPHGITWRVDGMDPLRPEIAIIFHNDAAIFRLWRSTVGLHLQSLDMSGDSDTIEVPDQIRAWSLVGCLMTPPAWFGNEQEVTVGRSAIDCILKWIRA
jgi:hypothetical protein